MATYPAIPGTVPGMRSNQTMSLEHLSLVAALDSSKFRLHSRKMMIALSHVIEEHGSAGGPQSILIAAFQRLSLFAVEAARYRLLALRFAQVFVLGVPDAPVADVPHVTIVPLDHSWPLVQEWSVIASGPQLSVGLFARDTEGFRPEKRSRAFEGLFTTDTPVVDAAVRQLHAGLGLPTVAFERNTLATLKNAQLIKRALAERI